MDTFDFGDPFATSTGGQMGNDNRKRPREEEEDDDDVQAGREISRTITHDNDEDADFVSSLLGGNETPNKLQQQGGQGCDFGTAYSWQQQQPSTAFMMTNYNNAMQPGVSSSMFAATSAQMQQQHQSSTMLLQAPMAYDSKMPPLDTLSNSGDTMMMSFSTDRTYAQFFPQQPPSAAQPIDNNRGPTMFVERWTCDIVSL